MKRRVLINVSNHPSSGWDSSQRAGWDEIIDIPFPAVDPAGDEFSVLSGPVSKLVLELGQIASEYPGQLFLHLVGEWYTVMNVLAVLIAEDPDKWILAFPTSSRETVERSEDGATIKQTIFKFVRWRYMPLAAFCGVKSC